MGASGNRNVAMKLPRLLNVCLKVSLALLLINFTQRAGAIRTREFRSYGSAVKNRTSRDTARGIYQHGDGRTDSGVASKDTDTAVLPRASSDASLICNPREDLQFTQDNQYVPSGMPTFRITFTNTCVDTSVYNVHILCGDFTSATLVNPATFRKLAVNDCLLNNGSPLAPQDSISFEYESSFAYPMDVGKTQVSS